MAGRGRPSPIAGKTPAGAVRWSTTATPRRATCAWTVTGTELPGLFGAVWNFKAYTDAPADPLLAMADKAFAEFIASKPPGSRGNEAQTSSAQSQSLERRLLLQPSSTSMSPDSNSAHPLRLGLIRARLAGTSAAARPSPSWTWPADAKPSGSPASRCSPPHSGALTLAGNSSFTVAAWVNNPEIGESECLISWAGRGGPDATTAQFGYGTHPEFGAVGHWGFADMGFRGAPPEAGQWHHLAVVFDGVIERVYVDGQLNNSEAKMLLMHEGRPVYVGASEPGSEYFDGSLSPRCAFTTAH